MLGNDDFGQSALSGISNMTYEKGTLPRTSPDAEKGFNFYDAVLKANAQTKKWIAYSVVVGSVIVLALSGVLVGLYLSGNLKNKDPLLKVVNDPAASAGDRNALTGGAMGGLNGKKSLDGSLNSLGGIAPSTPAPIDPVLLMAAAGSDVVDNVQDAVSNIVGTPKEVVSNVVDKVSDLVETPREILSDVVDNIGDALEAPREMIEDTIDTISDVLEGPSEVLSVSVGDILENAQDAVSDASETLNDRVEEVADNIGDILEDGPSSVLENVIENVSDNIEDSIEGASDATEEIADNIEDTLENIVEPDSMDDAFEKIFGDVDTNKNANYNTIDDDNDDNTNDEDDDNDNDDETDEEDDDNDSDDDNTNDNDKSVSQLGDDDRTDDTDDDDHEFDDIFDGLLKTKSLPSLDKNVADKLSQSTSLTGNDELTSDEDNGPFSSHNVANRASLLSIQAGSVPADTSFNSANLDSSTSLGLRGMFGDSQTGKMRYQAAVTNRALFASQPVTNQNINIDIPMPDFGLSDTTGFPSSSDWVFNDRSLVNRFNSLFSFFDTEHTTTEQPIARTGHWQTSFPTHSFDPFSSLMTHTAPIFDMRPFT